MAPKPIIIGISAGVAITVLVITLLITSLKRLNSTERMLIDFNNEIIMPLYSFFQIKVGVKYDNIAKTLSGTVNREGLHIGPPGFYFIIFPSVFQTLEFRDITVGITFSHFCF